MFPLEHLLSIIHDGNELFVFRLLCGDEKCCLNIHQRASQNKNLTLVNHRCHDYHHRLFIKQATHAEEK